VPATLLHATETPPKERNQMTKEWNGSEDLTSLNVEWSESPDPEGKGMQFYGLALEKGKLVGNQVIDYKIDWLIPPVQNDYGSGEYIVIVSATVQEEPDDEAT
jgi:hypothetical protein